MGPTFSVKQYQSSHVTYFREIVKYVLLKHLASQHNSSCGCIYAILCHEYEGAIIFPILLSFAIFTSFPAYLIDNFHTSDSPCRQSPPHSTPRKCDSICGDSTRHYSLPRYSHELRKIFQAVVRGDDGLKLVVGAVLDNRMSCSQVPVTPSVCVSIGSLFMFLQPVVGTINLLLNEATTSYFIPGIIPIAMRVMLSMRAGNTTADK